MTTTAQTLLAAFYTAENGNLCVNDTKPGAETVKDMVRTADNAGLGWDFAYQAVRDALQYLVDLDTTPEDNDEAHEFADGAVDIYNSDRLAWLAASMKHADLCTESAEELDTSYTDIIEFIGIGQYHAYTLAYQAVADNWPTEEDETEDDEA